MIEGLNVEKAKQELQALYGEIKTNEGTIIDRNEITLGLELIELVAETELPRFATTDLTSVKNGTVEGKYNLMNQIEELQGKLIPSFMQEAQPLDFTEENLKTDPRVNLVHAWMKVLNNMNSISAMQSGDLNFSVNVIAAIARDLYNFTTNADKSYFVRNDADFVNKQPFAETMMRKAGTEAVNAKRHVCYAEMRYIIEIVREAFPKES